jgi:hypothetical protein
MHVLSQAFGSFVSDWRSHRFTKTGVAGVMVATVTIKSPLIVASRSLSNSTCERSGRQESTC